MDVNDNAFYSSPSLASPGQRRMQSYAMAGRDPRPDDVGAYELSSGERDARGGNLATAALMAPIGLGGSAGLRALAGQVGIAGGLSAAPGVNPDVKAFLAGYADPYSMTSGASRAIGLPGVASHFDEVKKHNETAAAMGSGAGTATGIMKYKMANHMASTPNHFKVLSPNPGTADLYRSLHTLPYLGAGGAIGAAVGGLVGDPTRPETAQ